MSLSPTSSPQSQERIAYLDVARATAILLVVILHTWEGFVSSMNFRHALPGANFIHTPMSLDFIYTLPGYSVYQVVQTIGRFSVAFFIMLTGALMLGRSYPDIPKFFKKKLPRFLGALLVTAAVYALFVHALFGVDLKEGVGRFFRGEPIGGFHLWYLYMLIGLYLSVPYLARLVSVLTEKELIYLMLAALIVVTIPWTLNDVHSRFAYFVSYSFLIPTYMLYAITGYWLDHYRGLSSLSPTLRFALLALIIVGSVLIKLMADYQPGKSLAHPSRIWYDSFFLYTGATLLLSLIRDFFAHLKKTGATTALIARTAYATYLWHVIIVYIAMSISDHLGVNLILLFCLTIPLATLWGIFVYRVLAPTRFNWLVR